MEIEIWDGGLQEQEVLAIEKIKKAFSRKKEKQSNNGSNSIKEQLRKVGLGDDDMYPWKGYAGFRFIDSKGKEGEFDLIIITHCNLIIVELKDWNHDSVSAVGDIWYKGNNSMGRSPVSVTRSKKFTISNKLKNLADKFTNKGRLPYIEFFVVMTGNADFSRLPEDQQKHTISLQEFLKFSDKNTFQKYFNPHQNSKSLNKDFHIFDQLFIGKQTSPKPLRIAGYEAKEKIFDHPKNVYKEYLAKSEISSNSEALLRVWNFNNIQGAKAYTPEGRSEIVSREQEILQRIKHHNLDLYHHCLRSLTSFQKDQVTAGYQEVYELPPGHVRFNEFVGKYGQAFSDQDRLNVVKLLLAKFSDLHQAKIAHRDIADHSIWISPSKAIALSNFISAYYQPIGTVGDYRKSLSVGAIHAPQLLSNDVTPFQQDVHALALVSWHLLSGKRMSPKSMQCIEEDMRSCDKWFAEVLLHGVTANYESATAFFDALKSSEPTAKSLPTFDKSELDKYRFPINLTRQYPEDGSLVVESDYKEVYISNGCLVKAWLNIGRSEDSLTNFQVLRFLKVVDKLNSLNLSYLPLIRDYGIATKSSALYLVTEKIDGCCWSEAIIQDEHRIEIVNKFIFAIEHFHGVGVAHGDIHPGNVMIGKDNQAIYLIDIPDFSCSEEPKNHLYSPEYIDSCTAFERDNFAVMKMSCELLGITWGEEDARNPEISKAILGEIEDREFGFRDLGRFKIALKKKVIADSQETIDITAGDASEAITILPDNGKLFVKIEKNLNEKSEVRVTFMGVGGIFTALYNYTDKKFIVGFSPRDRSFIGRTDEDQSHFDIDYAIRIRPGKPQNLSRLTEKFSTHEAFQSALKNVVNSAGLDDELPLIDVVTEELREIFEKIKINEESVAIKEIDISTDKLWNAILDTETESNPHVEIYGKPIPVPDASNELILPYSSDTDPLDSFGSNDEVEVLYIDNEDNEKRLGYVCLKSSQLNAVKLIRARTLAFSLVDSDIIYFRSAQDRASYRKRRAALERILSKNSVIPNLAQLFDPNCQEIPTYYDIPITEEDFARYDREDQHGKLISLNPKQREAFRQIINNGPLSLLQGPPGTGKTEFIAAFVHFLIEKEKTRRILLVSQSHEAVNTAADRIRKHCARLGTSLELVRFSNREGAVSIGLKDVYSHAITTEKKELFNAELKYRVEVLSEALGLDSEFISEVVLTELQLFQQIDHLTSLLSQLADVSDQKDIAALKSICLALDQNIRETIRKKFGIELSIDCRLLEIKEQLLSKLCQDYGVKPNEASRVRAIAKITRDMQLALSGEKVNYDEFYARSRQLVTGTCVGIGLGHIGISQNVYDWVIIDEAARSISSELAIALQSAKRILLVGDHLQLPPLYSNAHKKAVAKKLGIKAKKEEFDEILRSDFARVFDSTYGQKASATLLTQYRMENSIGKLVSETFYKGKLQNPSDEDRREIPNFYCQGPKLFRNAVTWLDTSALGAKADHSDDRGVSIYNRLEADQIINVLQKISLDDNFVNHLVNLTEKEEAGIGVICMYAEQKRIIRQKFNQEIWPENFRGLVKIDTVDSYQGKENRIIILSITRSDDLLSPGFLNTPNRINVAMSRAMDRLLIVGNTKMWRGANKDLPFGKVISFMSEHGKNSGYAFIAVEN